MVADNVEIAEFIQCRLDPDVYGPPVLPATELRCADDQLVLSFEGDAGSMDVEFESRLVKDGTYLLFIFWRNFASVV